MHCRAWGGSPSFMLHVLTQVSNSKSPQFYGWWGLLRLLLHCQSWKKNNRQLYLVCKKTLKRYSFELEISKILVCLLTIPRKTNMEPKNDGVEYEVSYSMG